MGVFSITLSFGKFFTTQYYDTPLLAYNDNCSHDVVYGDTTARSEVGVFNIDNETALFIGALNSNCFVVAEMSIKNDKYAFKGTSMIYNSIDLSDIPDSRNVTNTATGYVEWSVFCNQSEIDALQNVNSVKSYTLPNGNAIYIAIFATELS